MEREGFVRDSPEIEAARERAFGRQPGAAEPDAAVPAEAASDPQGAPDTARRAIAARREALRQRLGHPPRPE